MRFKIARVLIIGQTNRYFMKFIVLVTTLYDTSDVDDGEEFDGEFVEEE